ncbi:hypothetical protein FBU30_008337 [Linnemannia zychae]|nr:hypothetical protein FBU30_008337 [Linnemannia zychae]
MSAMRHLLDLCKRRGFLFQSAEIHGGLRGVYDYGPLGVELKRNLSQEWWKAMVNQRSDVVGVDTAIITPPSVLKASGHVEQFSDQMVDSRLSKERFRPDKAPALTVDPEGRIPIMAPDRNVADVWEEEIRTQFAKGALISRKGRQIMLHVERMDKDKIILKKDNAPGTGEHMNLHIPYHGYVDPTSNSPFLTEPRSFNLMFKTHLGSIDTIDKIITTALDAQKSPTTSSSIVTRELVDKALDPTLTYLRPETAQGVFTNFLNVHRSHGHLKIPFGIAQIGKSFRNEIRLEHFIFRTPEFEQMELEYFVAPWQAKDQFMAWRKIRMDWWRYFCRNHDRIRERAHEPDELAHYSSGCVDVEYLFPWGWGEVEGIANRGDFDLRQHSMATGEDLEYRDRVLIQERKNREKETGVELVDPEKLSKERYLPHVVESSCGLNRAMLALMLDAMEVVNDEGKVIPFDNESDKEMKLTKGARTVLRLHPRLAPIKVAILPLITSNTNQTEMANSISQEMKEELEVCVTLETQSGSVGKRYYRMDEIGTPWCVTVDFQSLEDRMVTIRDRDTCKQRRVTISEAIEIVRDGLRLHPRGIPERIQE